MKDMTAADALRRYFGYETFRPLQSEIVAASLAGRDVLALLPTGGGKSLCYQLPAVLLPGLTVVVSPLIALMKDQVDALDAVGIPATFLNSSLDAGETAARMAALDRGTYRLLYLAPERALLDGNVRDLARWDVRRFAVDEAHCISEWGHDFRPEYRRIARLREHFPEAPFIALTATATPRVRADIAERLHLRDPAIFVGSFNRTNLTYRVQPKQRAADALVEFVRARGGDSGIVYAQSRASTEALAERLAHEGISAVAYHAGLSPQARSLAQERFARDDVRVVCATIAFGMGIDKSNVRFVVHHDVPKSIESYYQETGRAGRDGEPAECLLFFSHGDLLRLERFITAEASEGEAERARDQLDRMKRFVYASGCRRRELLAYFGEQAPEGNCGACDACLEPRAERDETLAAQQFLSCIYRVREASGFDVGLTHIVDVLVGAGTEKIERFGHERLSTFGIGRDRDRATWRHLGEEFLRLGLARRDPDRFNVVSVTPLGRSALLERKPVVVREAPPVQRARSRRGSAAPAEAHATPADRELFERLRRLRRELADDRNVPAYVIFSDAVLREIARVVPRTLAQFAAIGGVGQKKLADFGERFLREVGEP